ncbi:hypothetical protein LVJ83_08920 [Uruburuella testudinis]|uniref:Uncharacterized protein n=1 Tax=Uruburuella testudinis TaxID=1282863 RepID=A0ABY4DR59_9NEIS|nr:hypothetical protein [Uruburuella testudinis]UOO81097.1 hypothetical protein LVJ83_08920 [Uruburuella testudinis]
MVTQLLQQLDSGNRGHGMQNVDAAQLPRANLRGQRFGKVKPVLCLKRLQAGFGFKQGAFVPIVVGKVLAAVEQPVQLCKHNAIPVVIIIDYGRAGPAVFFIAVADMVVCRRILWGICLHLYDHNFSQSITFYWRSKNSMPGCSEVVYTGIFVSVNADIRQKNAARLGILRGFFNAADVLLSQKI